jgi:acyl-CoA synthetase (AMP-forming)/AMP-acid ligase II
LTRVSAPSEIRARIERSRAPDVAIPAVSLTQFFREHASRYASETAFIDGLSGRSLTFAALLAHSASFAHGLLARGLNKQDRVAFLVPNLPEVAIAFHGTIAAGGVAMMLNPLSTQGELEKYFSPGNPARVVTVAPFLALIRAAAPGLPIIVIGEASGPDCEPLTAFLGGPSEPLEVAIPSTASPW